MSLTRCRAPIPVVPWRGSRAHAARRSAACVHEAPGRYEDEGSERTSRGAVAVGRDAWWAAVLSVPVGNAGPGDLPLTLRLTRLGLEATRTASADLVVQLPLLELDAFLGLLAGVVAQARRDGVLPAA